MDEYAAALLESGMAPAFVVAVIDARETLAARTYGDAQPGCAVADRLDRQVVHGGDMLGYVSHMRVDTGLGRGVVALANGFGGARMLGEAALALHTGSQPPDPGPAEDYPERTDGACPPEWRGYLGRYRNHNPWLPTFAIAAGEHGLAIDTDWPAGSERSPLTPLADGLFRVGEPECSPERLRFDTIVSGRAQRAVLSGTPYYRACTGS